MTTIKKVASNMTELHLPNGNVVLFSYSTPVAACIRGEGYVRTEQYFSKTTSCHIGKWLDGVNAKTVPQADIEALTA